MSGSCNCAQNCACMCALQFNRSSSERVCAYTQPIPHIAIGFPSKQLDLVAVKKVLGF